MSYYQPESTVVLSETVTQSAPAPQKSSKGGLIAGAAAIALFAGAMGGGVGYLLAADSQSATPIASAITNSGGSVSVPVSSGIADIAAAVQPAVVQLNIAGSDGEGTGSGFVISDDGYIITNHHVAGPAGEDGSIEVSFADGSTATGRLVGSDPGYDLAVVKVDRTGLSTLELGSSDVVRVGDTAIAVGSPLGLQGTVTSGIVSALNRPVTAGDANNTSFINAIQTDAAINPGNSGGPLVDAAGQVIGVNSAIATMGMGGAAGSIGLGFAIPIDTAKRIAEEIITTGSSSTPIIGVQLDTTYNGDGALIADVNAGSPAEQAGLQDGDLITAINGVVVGESTDLIVAIRDNAPGDTITLTVLRNGQTSDFQVTLVAASK